MTRIAEAILNLPAEGVTAWGRLLLVFIAFNALLVSSPAGISPVHLVLLGYLGFAFTLVVFKSRRPFLTRTALIIHGVDIALSASLVSLTGGVTSPLFVLFLFCTVAGTLRWEWLGALLTTLALAGIFLVLSASGLSAQASPGALRRPDLVPVVMRGGFLLISGAMLAYMGAYRERARDRFAKLAEWPRSTSSPSATADLEAALRHAAAVMRVPRMLAIWDEADEPHRHVALWVQSGGLQYSQETSHVFGDLVGLRFHERPFLWMEAPKSSSTRSATALDKDLRESFGVTSAASAPFRRATCQGRVFALDRASFNEEDLSLISVIAAHIGVELEERILREQLASAAAEQERARLGRDLHDGVLQGLAAASIQLKVISIALPGQVQDQLKTVRNLLADEAHRIRGFVEATRKTAPSPTGIVRLAPEVNKRLDGLRQLWSCQIEAEITPIDLSASLTTTRNIAHMIGEAVANAVRHGRATAIKIRIDQRPGRILLSVQDNGNGFENLSETLTGTDLRADSTGPRSLRARIEDLGGTLYLSSSSGGTNVTVELPA